MRKLSRRQKLAIALSIFFGIIAIFVAFGLDGSHTVMPKKNMIFGIATHLSFKPIETYAGIWIMLFFLILYIVLFTVFICYLQNFLIKKEIALLSGKAFLYYGASFAIFFFLAFGLGTLFQIPNNGCYYMERPYHLSSK